MLFQHGHGKAISRWLSQAEFETLLKVERGGGGNTGGHDQEQESERTHEEWFEHSGKGYNTHAPYRPWGYEMPSGRKSPRQELASLNQSGIVSGAWAGKAHWGGKTKTILSSSLSSSVSPSASLASPSSSPSLLYHSSFHHHQRACHLVRGGSQRVGHSVATKSNSSQRHHRWQFLSSYSVPDTT